MIVIRNIKFGKTYATVESDLSTEKVAIDTVLYFHLKKDLEVTEEKWEEIVRYNNILLAKNYAFETLSRGSKTEKELRIKLYQKKFPSYAVDKALATAKEYGYLSDEAFVRSYVSRHGDYRGKLRLKQELTQKGVDKAVAEEMLKDREEGELCVQRAQVYMKGKEYTLKTREKLMRHLLSRGFSYDDVKEAVRKVTPENGWGEEIDDD